MKAEELYKGVIEIDDKYIEEALERKQNRAYPAWKRYAAACLCLIAVSAVILLRGRERPTADDAEACHLTLLQDSAQGAAAEEVCTLSYADRTQNLEHLVMRPDGAVIPAVFVPASADDNRSNDEGMTLEEAQSFAYMDLNTAPAALQETIRKAREVIIYSRSWVADGFEAYTTSPDGTTERVPAFSELFPGWELPTVDPAELSMTADGLGSNAEYGIFVEVAEIRQDCMLARAASSLAPFQTGQSIRVYYPAGFDASSLKEGEIRFVSFCGKDCSAAGGTVYAREIRIS